MQPTRVLVIIKGCCVSKQVIIANIDLSANLCNTFFPEETVLLLIMMGER